jgi:hypothetical protein
VSSEAVISRFLDELRVVPGASVAAPGSLRQIERVDAFVGARLPEAHRELLLAANGFSTSFGYQRFFGVGDGGQDVGPWNAHHTWKFAWPRQLEDYLSIGQTGWGDQLVYRLGDLKRGRSDVYWLDHFLMEVADEPIADSFESLLNVLLAAARAPGDGVQEARRQIGDLGPDQLAVFSPSPLLIGLERATALSKMDARIAMVTSGDLAAQLIDTDNQTRRIDRIDTYLDERGRSRLRVIWVPLPSLPDDTPALTRAHHR